MADLIIGVNFFDFERFVVNSIVLNIVAVLINKENVCS